MNDHELTVRPFELADCEWIIEISNKLNLSSWSRRDLEAESRRDDAFMRVAAVQERPIGFIVARIVPGEHKGSLEAELYNIGVDPEFQRTGTASRLLNGLIEFCGGRNASSVWLEVRAGNDPAIMFYRRFGFRRIAIRTSFYDRPKEDGIVMKLDLPGEGI